MKTWFDIELLLDKIESLDKATLESFSIVAPPPSQNPAFHQKFNHTHQRILRRLNQIEAEEVSAKVPNPTPQPPPEKPNHIHNIGVGVIIVVLGSAAIWSIAYYFDVHL
jgi:hypothetical protein